MDQKFQQNKKTKIQKLNSNYNVDTFSARLKGDEAFAAEQKIREFQKLLFKSGRIEKYAR